jgi:hypothetical protein
MKKIHVLLSGLLIFVLAESTFAQLAKDSWSLGFGFSYPRFHSTDVRPLEENYGGFLSLQRNFSENVALRLMGNYHYIMGRIPGPSGIYQFKYTDGTIVPSMKEEMSTTIIGGNLDVMYYFTPCSPVNPYFASGVGVVYYDPSWPDNIVNPGVEAKATVQFNLRIGTEWRLGRNFNLITEIGFHSLDGQVDGIVNNNRQGMLGSHADGYISANVGFNWYFSKGEPSRYCEIYEGIDARVEGRFPTLNEIEALIEKHIPKEVIKEVVVEKPTVGVAPREHWVLFGVNFDFDKATLRPESYPILEHAVRVLKDNPGIKVEIQGYTDNVGSDAYNQKLSEQRAKTVYDYLAKAGVASNRLSTVGFGEKQPIGDNSTAMGRAQNRRIEFRVTAQ